jgi:hypothetical protein
MGPPLPTVGRSGIRQARHVSSLLAAILRIWWRNPPSLPRCLACRPWSLAESRAGICEVCVQWFVKSVNLVQLALRRRFVLLHAEDKIDCLDSSNLRVAVLPRCPPRSRLSSLVIMVASPDT